MSWIENPVAFAILFEAAGLSWTLSSEIYGYEATNYGTWYDDVQFARIALKQVEVARRLKVKKMVMGECGHAHKGLIVIADRILVGDMNFPRESFLPLLEDLVCNGKLKLDPGKNNFPVTLHDPCNMVRLMGIVEPQRRILRKICPQFQGDGTPRGGELLLRRRKRFCHHELDQFQGVEGKHLQPDEAEADPRVLSGCPGSGHQEVCLCPLLELQRGHPGHPQQSRLVGKTRLLLRGARGARSEWSDGSQEALHRLGMALIL